MYTSSEMFALNASYYYYIYILNVSV